MTTHLTKWLISDNNMRFCTRVKPLSQTSLYMHMLKKAFFSPRTALIFLAVLAMAAITIPAIATPDLWNWSDASASLPVREGVSLNLVSERAGNWLVSDSRRLYRYDGEALKDMTPELRAKGMLGVSNIFSDGNQWMVVNQALDREQPYIWLTNGEAWTEVSGRFPYAQGGLDAVGSQGTWYVRTYAKPQGGLPASWTMYRWWGAQTQPQQVELPLGKLTNAASGCLKGAANSVICTGVNTPLHVKGHWYFIGGTSQLKGTDNTVVQAASTHLWNIDGNTWREIAIPNIKFVSGVWQSEDQVLIATSDVTSNPFASDRFWVFDGTTMREVSDQALGAGLLSIDAREIKASWNGRAWVIVAGKNLVRFDGQRMTRQTPSRDLFVNLASNTAGVTLFVGAASTPELGVASSPLMGKLVLMNEDFDQTETTPSTVSNLATEIISKTFGPEITVTSNPVDARIGDGKQFIFSAQSTAKDLDHIDIYVNGARIKSCYDSTCSYAQTYWSLGNVTRRVQFVARAINHQNIARESAPVSLIVDANSSASASAMTTPTNEVISESATLPTNLPWTMDGRTGITWATWLTPNETVLKTQPVKFHVAARAAQGLDRIELWVNGSVKDTCAFDGKMTDARTCQLTLTPSDLPNGADVFVNARIVDHRDMETWSTGTNFHRERPAVNVTSVSPSANTIPTQAGAIFSASATLEPAAASVLRGNRVTYRVTAQNNSSGLRLIEVLANGTVKRACSFGAAVSAVTCDLALDTSTYQPGTTITLLAHAIDNNGQEVWSNGKSILVRATEQGPESNEAPTKADNGLSVWSWMAPAQDVIAVNETATYTVGAWAPRGIKTIEMIADGVVRKSCAFGTKGSKECSYTIGTNDFSDEHLVVMNARVTDMDGIVNWSDVRAITVKRTWNNLSNPPSYAQVTNNRPNGYVKDDQISFTMRGWSPRALDHMDLFVNGKKVFTCPGDRCTWTTPVYNQPTLEYQVRMIDQNGQEAWSGLYGLRRK